MTLRLAADQAAALDTVARADDVPVSQAVRDAIDEHIERRRNDREFQKRLERLVSEQRETLARLAK